MGEWKALSAGRELDKLIADRLGYKVYSGVDDYWIESNNYHVRIAKFSTDIHMAIQFFLEVGIEDWSITHNSRGYNCSVDGSFFNDEAYYRDAAYAMCRCGLAWMDAQEDMYSVGHVDKPIWMRG